MVGMHAGSTEGAIAAVVFDMGGVLVELAPLEDMLVGVDLDRDELWERWILSGAVKAYEGGRCDVDEFLEMLIAELGVELDPAELLERFRSFPQGLFEGARELLDEVRAACPIGILSNTNDLHWSTQIDNEYLRGAFDHEYLSYAVGLVKPERDIYDHVVSDLNLAAERVLFLDDNLINVKGARAAGLKSEVVKGPSQARAALVAHGVLASE